MGKKLETTSMPIRSKLVKNWNNSQNLLLRGKSNLEHTYEYMFAVYCTCIKLPWNKLIADGTYWGDGNLVNGDRDEGKMSHIGFLYSF